MQNGLDFDPCFLNLYNTGHLTGKISSCFPKLEPPLSSRWVPAASSPDCCGVHFWEAVKNNEYSYS